MITRQRGTGADTSMPVQHEPALDGGHISMQTTMSTDDPMSWSRAIVAAMLTLVVAAVIGAWQLGQYQRAHQVAGMNRSVEGAMLTSEQASGEQLSSRQTEPHPAPHAEAVRYYLVASEAEARNLRTGLAVAEGALATRVEVVVIDSTTQGDAVRRWLFDGAALLHDVRDMR